MANPPIDSISIGFPQINQPWQDEHGTINQLWLQLLIALWNRTGAASGGSITNITNYFVGLDGEAASSAEVSAAMDAALLALTTAQQQAVDAAVARYFLLNPPPVVSDPLLALLFADSASAGGIAGSEWCMNVIAAPVGLVLSGEACGTLFTNEA